MNFKALQDEVIRTRFDESDRDRIKNWINIRYKWIWDQADWTFKRVPATNLAVVGGDSTPVMPTDLAKVLRVYDDQGTELGYCDPNTFESYSLTQPTAVSTRPYEYTVIDRQVWLYPTPSATATYKLSYFRRVSHVDASLGVVGGIFVQDTDQPLWPAEHDYVLVVDAVILGQKMRNDPTWTMLIDERNELLSEMKRDITYDVVEQVGHTWAGWGDQRWG